MDIDHKIFDEINGMKTEQFANILINLIHYRPGFNYSPFSYEYIYHFVEYDKIEPDPKTVYMTGSQQIKQMYHQAVGDLILRIGSFQSQNIITVLHILPPDVSSEINYTKIVSSVMYQMCGIRPWHDEEPKYPPMEVDTESFSRIVKESIESVIKKGEYAEKLVMEHLWFPHSTFPLSWWEGQVKKGYCVERLFDDKEYQNLVCSKERD